MHEMSIALALVDLASDACARLGATRIEALHIRVGPLSGVVEQALRFSFELAAEKARRRKERACASSVRRWSRSVPRAAKNRRSRARST